METRNHRAVSATNPAVFNTSFKPLTGGLGLVKDLSASWQVYAQASSAADPPAGVLATAGFNALRDLELTRGRQFELGSKLGFDGGRGTATLAVYDITRKHLSIVDPNDRTKRIPVGEQSSQGVEASARWRASAAWAFSGHLSHTKARYENFVETVGSTPTSRAGMTPANVPDWVAGAAVDWQVLDVLGLGADLRHVGKRYGNTANTLWDVAYQLLGLSANWAVSRHASLQVRLDNVTDQRYVADLNSSLPYLGAPRSTSVALDYKL